MKRTLSIILCLLMLLQMTVLALPVVAAETNSTLLYEDSFDYSSWGPLYDDTNLWQTEYQTSKTATDDYGAYNCADPTVENGVLKLGQGAGLRMNWTKLPGFSEFDASKTYTITFDVKVTTFGTETDGYLGGTQNSRREFYFAPGGYYNSIMFQKHNDGGIQAGAANVSGSQHSYINKDMSLYKLNTVYSCTFQWSPSKGLKSGEGYVLATVKEGDKVISQGYRSLTDLSSYNKYTRSFVWRCCDGASEVDNIVFTDGTTTYVQNFDSMAANSLWGGELYLTSGAQDPELNGDGILHLNEYNGVTFNWTQVPGLPEYSTSNVYTFEYDAKITDEGDGSIWTSTNTRTRALYVGFGSYYDLLQIPSKDNKIETASTSVPWNAKYVGQNLHIKMMLAGDTLTTIITDQNGNVVLNGYRTSANFTNVTATRMQSLGLRCEDGAVEIDNFKFSVETSALKEISTIPLTMAENQQAIYTCDVAYTDAEKTIFMFGTKKLFALEEGAITVGGKKIPGTYGTGTYKLKLWLNPVQEMIIAEATTPNGEVSRRGCYNLIDGETITISSTEKAPISNDSLVYENISANDYELTLEEPQYTGFDANVYNLVTSFENAASDRAFAWTALASYIGSESMAVCYREQGQTEWTEVVADKETDSVAAEDYFKCDISGLKADTTYEYKIGKPSADEWSKVCSFKTAKENIDEFTFVAVGDTQGITWGGTTTSEKGFMYAKASIDEMFKDVENPAFMLHTGDIVETGGNTNQWNMYFKALGEHGATTPHFATLGNHDALSGGMNFKLHFNHPNNGGTAALDQEEIGKLTVSNLIENAKNADESIYSYDYGNAHFIVLNTGIYNHAEDRYLLEAQRQWLINDLEANKDARWTVMLFHQAVYHRSGGNYDRDQLRDVIEGYGVDLVLQGHSHLVTRTYPMKDGQIVTKENPDTIQKGVGTIYTTIGSTALNHDGAGDASNDEEMYHIVTPTATQPAYTSVTVNDESIVVTVKQVNGMVIDRFEIKAPIEAKIENTPYATLEKALAAANPNDTVKLCKNLAEKDFLLVNSNVTLDLNGNTLTADHVVGLKGSAIIDGSDTSSGKLVVAKNCVALDKTNGGYLPVYENGAYKFTTIGMRQVFSGSKYLFSPTFESFVHDALAAGMDSSAVKVVVRVNWQGETYNAKQDFIYVDSFVKKVVESYGKTYANDYEYVFSAALKRMGEEVSTMSVSAVVISDTGVEVASEALPYVVG